MISDREFELVLDVLTQAESEKSSAICRIKKKCSGRVRGYLKLYSEGPRTRVKCHLRGLKPGNHGLHVHRCGDLSRGCQSTCDHYNPSGTIHGGATGLNRHRGDFGNISADNDGVSETEILADVNLHEVIGRAFVIHADEDDLGKGPDKESLKTGNAGKRIACGLIKMSERSVNQEQKRSNSS